MRFNELQVRPPNRSRTGAESALRVNSKHEYRENSALKFGVCFRPRLCENGSPLVVRVG